MTSDSRLIYDDVLEAPSAASIDYTSLVHAEYLAGADQMVFHLITVNALGLGDAPVVAIEVTGDGRVWTDKPGGNLTLTAFYPSVDVTHYVGAEPWPPPPNMRFARVRVQVSNKGNPYSARVQLRVTRRMQKRRGPVPMATAQETPARPATRARLGLATLSEMTQLLAEERSLGPGAHERVASRLSASARKEVSDLLDRSRALTSSERLDIVAAVMSGKMGPGRQTAGDCGGDCGDGRER